MSPFKLCPETARSQRGRGLPRPLRGSGGKQLACPCWEATVGSRHVCELAPSLEPGPLPCHVPGRPPGEDRERLTSAAPKTCLPAVPPPVPFWTAHGLTLTV